MNPTNHTHAMDSDYAVHSHGTESSRSAVSWGAVLAGAVSATAIVIVLLSIGSGLGLAAMSPYKHDGASAATLSLSAVIGLIVIQWLSAAFGGYVTGRLRTKWADPHADEVYFRDTAHGFLSWALGAVLGTVLLASAIGSVVGAAGSAATTVAGGAAMGASQGAAANAGSSGSSGSVSSWMDANGYSLDTLFRSERPNPQASDAEVRAESTRILVRGVKNEGMSPEDRAYLSQVIASRTNISQDEAQARIDQVTAQLKDAEAKARETADNARKQAAKLAMYTALSMLIGAFVAGASAVLGGRHRDQY